MRITTERLLFWTPRVLTMLFAAFISVFALDAFDGRPLGAVLPDFLLHLVPSAVIVALLWISWRHERLGGFIFLLFGIAYVVGSWDRFDWATFLLIGGPCVLVGTLLLLHARLAPRPVT